MTLNKKRLIRDLSIGCGIIVVVALFCWLIFGSSDKHLGEHSLEINHEMDYTKYVEQINAPVSQIIIDDSLLETDKVGKYDVILKVNKKEYTLIVNVIDTTPPIVETQDLTIMKGETYTIEDFIVSVEDDSPTTLKYQNDKTYESAGVYDIVIIVSDSSQNETKVNVKLTINEDTTAPYITGSNQTYYVGTTINYKGLVKVSDDYDPSPTLTIDSSAVDINTPGKYSVYFTAVDASGNKASKTLQVTIKEKPVADGTKIVYLTFDDGPSKFTPEVLKILDQYGAKATFFVTGLNPGYFKYISDAHNAGHTIGLHTYSHDYSKLYASTDAYFNDLDKIGNLVKDYIGYVPKYIRFPGGSSNAVSKKYSQGIMTKLVSQVQDKGYIYYDWNAENGDGRNGVSEKEMIKLATSSSANEIMILMHDANGKQSTINTLPTIIEYYLNKGYVFKAIDDTSIVPHHSVNN